MESIVNCMVTILLVTGTTNAAILGHNQLEIDLTDLEDIHKKATWSPNSIDVTRDGLGWNGDTSSSRGFWILTKPVGIGTSWRPTTNASIRITISPEARSYTLANGQSGQERLGAVYVRFSPDRKHWSTWQPVQLSTESKTHAQKHAVEKKRGAPFLRSFSTSIRVPQRAREKYLKLFSEYGRSDVPWKSDEEAFVKQLVVKDPDFFKQQLAFVGHVQFLLETQLSGGHRLTKFRADIGWAVGGLHVPAKDPAVGKNRDGEWRFVIE